MYVKIMKIDGAIRNNFTGFHCARSNKERDSQDLNIILTQLRYNCLFVLLVKYSLTFAKFPLPTYYYHYYESLLILVEVQ